MLHWSQDASTGWTRNSLGESMAKRACLSVVHGFGRERNNRVAPTPGIYHPLPGRCRIAIRVDAVLGRSYAAPSESPRAREQHPGDAGSVTVSEFLFLALGLVLGVASGAALIEII